MEAFRQILYDLSELLSEDLFIDKHGVCRIVFNETIVFQLELDPYEQHLFLISPIAEVPPGKYREQVFKEALKDCARSKGSEGVLSFAPTQNKLCYHLQLPLERVNGDRLATALEMAVPKVESWMEALNRGTAGPNPTTPLPADKPPPFMKR